MTFYPGQLIATIIYLIGAVTNGILIGLLPYLIIGLAALIVRRLASPTSKSAFARILAFAFIGTFLGMFTGASKEPVVAECSQP